MDHEAPRPRPRLLLFRWTKPGLPPFLQQHLEEHCRSLGHFFDVRVVDYDCDYAQLCDEFEPDLAVFESGVYAGGRTIANTSAHPDVPKLGFLHADAYDLARATFLSDMERWGVEDFFTTSVVMADYTPEISDRLFVWPNAIDPAIYRDHGLEKVIPVLFTGSQERQYPWRNAVSRVVAQQFTTMTMPHFGWGAGTGRTLFGEDYARMLNASVFVPTCGSMAHEVVRKHLEIPGCGACLVTERTAALEAFGFEDMVNCVFADARSAVDKLDQLFADPARLARITRAGHDLVHSRHTQQSRSQVLQWLQLHRTLRPGERIVQENPSGPLSVAAATARMPVIASGGLDRARLAEGWRLLRSGRPAEGERQFLMCLNYYFIPEAVVGLTYCALARGDAGAARDWTTQALVDTFEVRGGRDPDPVLWACHLRSLLCAGEAGLAADASRSFPRLRHRELDRVRSVVAALAGATDLLDPGLQEAATAAVAPRASVCPVPDLADGEWQRELAVMLTACGQSGLAAGLSAPDVGNDHVEQRRSDTVPGSSERRVSPAAWLERAAARSRRRVRWWLRTGVVMRLRVKLSPLKQRIVADDWSRLIRDLVRREDLERAIVVGQGGRAKDLRAMQAGLRENPGLPPIDMVDAADAAAVTAAFGTSPKAGRALAYIAPGAAAVVDAGLLAACRFVILDGAVGSHGYRLLAGLLDDGAFRLLAHEPELNEGCAILERCAPNARSAPIVT